MVDPPNPTYWGHGDVWTKMRKHPSTIESTYRSTADRTRPLNPAVSFTPGLSGLHKQRELTNDFRHQFEIVQAGKS
jgi:hypothetical protein